MISLDTNVLIYAFDPSDYKKHTIASKLLKRAIRDGSPIAAQVYGEFFTATVRKKIATRLLANDVLETWSSMMPPLVSSWEGHLEARKLAADHQLQYWDALIIATCAEHGVTRLYTEDVPGLTKPLGVTCVSPFDAS
ncbi:MAG: PIN domain-containing protein [Betaproteobacteria bacterium]|nr:MAG: PIN domain-containing protein [Betaproteobacteria bacterium]